MAAHATISAGGANVPATEPAWRPARVVGPGRFNTLIDDLVGRTLVIDGRCVILTRERAAEIGTFGLPPGAVGIVV